MPLRPAARCTDPLLPARYVSSTRARARSPQVGIGLSQDAKYLSADYGVRLGGGIDVTWIAQKLGYPRPGLKAMCAEFGTPLSKPFHVTMSDWEAAPLSAEQVAYGAEDAFASLWVAACLHARHGDGEETLEAYLRRRLPKVEVIAEVRLGYERADILSDIAAIGRCNALDYIKEVDRVDDETGAVTRIKVLKDVSELTRAQAAGIDEVVFNSKLGIIGYTLAPALTRLKALTTLGEQTAGFAKKDETKHQHVHFHAIDLEKVRELKAQLRAIAPPEMVRDIYGRSEEEAAQ